jgi:site-specific DNA recombinase
MYGKVRHGDLVYYVCAPKKGYLPNGHPGASTFWIREDAILHRLNEFLSHHVFGTYRHSLLDTSIRELGNTARQDREQRIAALRREIAATELKSKRAIRSFELVDQPDQELIRDVNERRAELRQHKAELERQLAAAEEELHNAPNADLLDALPLGPVHIDQLPEELARRLFEALRLELRYNKTTNRLTCRITLTGPTITAAQRAAHKALVLPFQRKKDRQDRRTPQQNEESAMPDTTPVPILVVPPAGFEPATYRLGGGRSIP